MPLFGRPVPRTEDPRFLTGSATYVADLDLPGVACVTYVVSPVASARIASIDVTEARALPGVLDVVVAADLDLGPLPAVHPSFPEAMARPLLADGAVRFVGEPVVAIVSESAAIGADAAELVVLDLEPLPPVVTVEAARDGDVLLFPDAGTTSPSPPAAGAASSVPEGCEVSVQATFRSPRLAPAPMERARLRPGWERDGRLTHWLSCQGPHPVRDLLCRSTTSRPSGRGSSPRRRRQLRRQGAPVPEDVLLPALARRVGRPVRWTADRSDDMVGLGHGRAQVQEVALGGRRDGTLEALTVRVLVDAGAYPQVGAMLGRNTGVLSPGPYRLRSVHWELVSVVTSTTPTTAYRGAGRPEATALLERAVDLFAAEIGMDPAELRRHNLIGADEFPYTSATELVYDSGSYAEGLERALAIAGYEDLRAEQAARRAAGDPIQLGIGLATFIDRTSGVPGAEYGSVELLADGSALVRTGSNPYGQGHHTSWAMLVADRTGIPMERIRVVHGDTDVVPKGGITGGSRSVQKAGSAVASAADLLVERARQVAADLLEASAGDVVVDLDGGRGLHVAGTPSRTVDVGRGRHRASPTTASGARPRWRSPPPSPPAPTWRSSRWRSTPGWCACGASSRSTTPAPSSTRSSPPGRSTAAPPRAWPRPSSRSSPTTRTPTRSPPRSPTTRSSAPASCRASRAPSWRPAPRTTRSAPRASPSRGRSARHRPCRTRWSTPSPTSACATSTCRARRSGCGGRSPRRRPPAPPGSPPSR
jgi:carbon-monoxide dehydrogenase large subunit